MILYGQVMIQSLTIGKTIYQSFRHVHLGLFKSARLALAALKNLLEDKMTIKHMIAAAASGVAMVAMAGAAQADVLFWSTQAKPAQESQAMREQVLAGAGMDVNYQGNDGGPWLTRLQAELQAGSGEIGVLGALHGDFAAMDPADLVDLDALGVSSASGTFNSLAKLGTSSAQYIPWMQASHLPDRRPRMNFCLRSGQKT